jgi:hypothetical protein
MVYLLVASPSVEIYDKDGNRDNTSLILQIPFVEVACTSIGHMIMVIDRQSRALGIYGIGEPGTYSNYNHQTGETIIYDCPLSTYTPIAGLTHCFTCDDGKYTKTIKTTICSSCPRRYICPNGELISCPAGRLCPYEGMIIPLLCSNGYYCPGNGSDPILCPVGSYCPLGINIANYTLSINNSDDFILQH